MKTVSAGIMCAALTLGGAAQAETQVTPLLRFQAEQRYDDDLLLRRPDSTLPGQLITKLSPTFGLDLKNRASTLNGWGAVDMLYKPATGAVTADLRTQWEGSQKISARLLGKLDVRAYRVSDPTSLIRIGVAKTLSPVFYGKVRTSAIYQASRRWTVDPALTLEGARVFEIGRQFGSTVTPAVEGWYAIDRRSSIGPGYRLQLFSLGNDRSFSNGVFGNYRFRFDPFSTLTASAGPVFFHRIQNGTTGILPRALVELSRDVERLELAAALGNDLVGSSGFSDAILAQYVSGLVGYRAAKTLRLTAMASYYRNGEALNANGQSLFINPQALSGYAAEGRLEWRVHRNIRIQGSLIRLAQVGTVGTPLSRNIAAVRLILTNEN